MAQAHANLQSLYHKEGVFRLEVADIGGGSAAVLRYEIEIDRVLCVPSEQSHNIRSNFSSTKSFDIFRCVCETMLTISPTAAARRGAQNENRDYVET
ncbi:unnamed protein product [Symbiodinium microadriaticum]|nr:unnamed protein product [Symbiodinium microadriaticum]